MKAPFDIPEVIQITIVTTWLQLKDLARLDSALCSYKRRKAFHDLIASASCVLPGPSSCDGSLPVECLEWLFMQNVKLRAAILTREQADDAPTVHELFAVSGAALRSLIIHLTEEGVLNPPFLFHTRRLPCFDLGGLLVEVKKSCPGLHTLSIDGDAVSETVTHTTSITTLPPQLHTLILECLPLSAETITCLTESVTLRNLHNWGCTYAATEGQSFSQNAHLHSLDCDDVTWTTLFPNVTTLRVSPIRSMDLDTLIQSCPNVRTVTLGNVHGEISSLQAFSMSKLWTKLLHLSVFGGPNALHEFVVCEVIMLCPQLETLCTMNVGNVALPKINNTNSNHSKLPGSQLTTLAMHCQQSSTLIVLTTLCMNLHTLHLRGTRGPTLPPATSTLLFLRDSNVRALYLYDYSGLSDEAFVHLRHHCVEILSLEGCSVTDAALLKLLPTLKQLHTLKVKHCTQLSERLVAKIPKLCPPPRTFWFINHAGCRCDIQSKSDKVIECMMRELHPQIKDCRILC